MTRRSKKIAFYGLTALFTVGCILALFTYAYAGSYNPADLFNFTDFTFSYTGAPAYTNLYADEYYIGLSGINGSTTNLTLRGPSHLVLYPKGNVTMISANGSQYNLGSLHDYPIDLRPDESAWVQVLVQKDDDFNYNMRFHYNNSTAKSGGEDVCAGDLLRVIRKSNNERGNSQYAINSTHPAGAAKMFEVKSEPCWCFPIMVATGKSKGDSYGAGMEVTNIYKYQGQINVSTTGGLWMRSPVSALSPDNYSRLELEHAEGSLDIKHIEHKCNPADTVSITTMSDNNVSLMNGLIIASGRASALDFREQSFGRPITVIIKEGNYAILTGLLSSFLTIILARLVKIIKRK